MKNKKRSAFTIVELVIVIAVIAILSAVLIPTFGAIIKDANIAADQTAAATLTTELHVELKGKQITSEEDLMQALTDSGVAEKLVPKSLGYGYHFWFNMETQSIFVAKAEEVEAMPAANLSASVEEPSGAVLASAMLVDNEPQTVTSVFNGIRDIFNKGYILIDSADTLANIFGDMSAIDATGENSYLNYIKNLTDAANNDEIYGIIANAVLNNFKKTVVINGNGVFYFSEAASGTDNLVYFANGVKIISTTHYVYNGTTVDEKTNGTIPTPAGNKISLPSSVVLVEEGALDFGDGNSVVINTSLANENAIANVFAPKSTDAIIKSKVGTEYKVTVGTSPNYPDNGANSDILVTKADDAFVADLIVRLPFENFEIGYETKEDLVEFNTDTLYISNLVNDQVVLFAKDIASDATSLGVYKWESDNTAISVQGGVLSFDEDAILAGSHRATITAYAKNLSGEDREDTLKIEVRIVESATVKIGDYDYPLGQGDQHLSYYVSAQNHTITPVASVYWKQVENETLYDLRAGDLLVKDGAGQVCADNTVSFGADSTNYSFTVSIDGRLETKFTVAVIDLTNAPFQLNFHHSSEYSPYYVGSGDELKLSDIFNLKEGFDFQGATVTVYGFAEGGTDLYSVYEINNYRKAQGQLIWADEDTITISKDENWEDKTIRFRTDNGYSHTSAAVTGNYDVVIEIAPINDVAMIAHVVVVGDATNASNAAELTATHSSSVILHNDVTITTGNKVTLGANNLYGNGYIITADKYVSSVGETVLTDSLISVNGGTIENIYLDGPVYPTLDYTKNTNKYYVAGIRADGTSTITKSYVSGFREPVMAVGTLLNVTDTVLHGGNYGNLVLNKGNLYLKNVTTIQDQNGSQATVGDTTKKVVGMGIILEKDTISSTVTLDGNITHYNWIEKDQTGTLPIIQTFNKELDMKTLFDYIFDGVLSMRIGRFLAYIHQDSSESIVTSTKNTANVKEYVNAGIVFMDAQETADDTVIAESSIKSGIVKFASTYSSPRKHSLVTMQASNVSGLDATSILGMDVSIGIWSYKDGRSWSKKTGGFLGLQSWYESTYSSVVTISSSDLNYSGYYTNYGE